MKTFLSAQVILPAHTDFLPCFPLGSPHPPSQVPQAKQHTPSVSKQTGNSNSSFHFTNNCACGSSYIKGYVVTKRKKRLDSSPGCSTN